MTCAHHWLLQGSASNNVPAQCRNCGDTRVFKGDYENPVEAMRRSPFSFKQRSNQSDDGIRATDLAHFRQSWWEGA
jgi:hypothetical protein